MNAYLTRNIEGIAGRSDHRRAVEDETWAETRAVVIACTLLFVMALLSAFGVI